jgi:dTDP-4-amino-4,6-dideoxygalactose transaminase
VIPFSPPRIDQKIIDEVVDTLRSGWITTGPKTKLFEKMLADYCKVQSVVCLNSATAGLELMLRWFGVGIGDEVILPAYTYSATANVIIHCGAKPVFVDVNEDFNIDAEKVRKAVTKKTKVIMPVDFGGWPCDYDSLNEIVNDASVKKIFTAVNDKQRMLGRILILSDAAHSLGAIYKGRRTGSLADCTVFSFHAVKNLTTAEGGAVALHLPEPFDNKQVYGELCIKSLHGQNKDALSKMKAGNWKYDIVEAGYKMNMTDILASIGLVELNRYDDDTLVKRREICRTYAAALESKKWAIIPVMEKADEKSFSSFHLFPLRIKGIDEDTRDRIIQKISDSGVSVNVHFIPVPMTSFYKSLGYDIHDYPVTYNMFSNEISLPVFYDLTTEQISTVIQTINTCIEKEIQTQYI